MVAFWARSGFMVDLVKPDEYPLYSPAGFGDLAVGNTLFGGICAALFNRYRTGKGDRTASRFMDGHLDVVPADTSTRSVRQ